MMKEMCPISPDHVNERAVQLNAALSTLSLIVFFFTPYHWIILILTVDFFIRGFLNPTYSFYSAMSKTMLRMFNIQPVMVNAGPKIFAARIGFILCFVIALLYLLQFQKISLIVGLIFMVFASLEAIFKYCIACKIYPLLQRSRS